MMMMMTHWITHWPVKYKERLPQSVICVIAGARARLWAHSTSLACRQSGDQEYYNIEKSGDQEYYNIEKAGDQEHYNIEKSGDQEYYNIEESGDQEYYNIEKSGDQEA